MSSYLYGAFDGMLLSCRFTLKRARDMIPTKILAKNNLREDTERIFLVINFPKPKWLFCGTYHPLSQNARYFFNNRDRALDIYCSFEKIALAGILMCRKEEGYLTPFYIKSFEVHDFIVIIRTPHVTKIQTIRVT